MVRPSSQAIVWQKSSRSVGDGACVEVAFTDCYVLVRDSKHRNGPILELTVDSWVSLIESIKQRLLDSPFD